MSLDFTKVLVMDDRLDVVDNIKYAVIKGGQNVTPSHFGAISESNNQLVFNVQVPSEQTIIDRRVLLQTELSLTVVSRYDAWDDTGALIAHHASNVGCGYGSCAGLAAYPLHQAMTVASATINNNTVSLNVQDVLPAIVRLLNKEKTGVYNGMTATSTDCNVSYSLTAQSPRNPLGGKWGSTLDTDLTGNGSVVLKSYVTDYNPAATSTTETFTWLISEPLMLSPFIYSNPKNSNQGFYGIQNMNFVFNLDASVSRIFRGLNGVNGLPAAGDVYASPAGQTSNVAGQSLPYIVSVQPGAAGLMKNSQLLFTFLTPHPENLMPARNIVPYYELPRYISQRTAISACNANLGIAYPNNFTLSKQRDVYTSQTLQINQIPDKLLVWISKQSKSFGDADVFFPIDGVRINFNNNSGILSAALCQDLYRMGKDNGLNMSWNEWNGYESTQLAPLEINNGAQTGIQIESSSVDIGQAGCVATCGSLLVLEFGKDIQLTESFFAPGSLGNFNLQIELYAGNNNASIAAGDNVNMYVCTMNSGVFCCERGTSSTYTGILTRADVLEASDQDAYTQSDVRRMVGSGFFDFIKSAGKKLAPLVKQYLPKAAGMAKEYLRDKGDLGKAASGALEALGYGHSGAGMSAGKLHGRVRM